MKRRDIIMRKVLKIPQDINHASSTKRLPQHKNSEAVATIPNRKDLVKDFPTIDNLHDFVIEPPSEVSNSVLDTNPNVTSLENHEHEENSSPVPPMSPETLKLFDILCKDTRIHAEPCLENNGLPTPNAPTSSPSNIAKPYSVDSPYNDLPMDPSSVDSCCADFSDAPKSPSTGLEGSYVKDSRCTDLPISDEPTSMTDNHAEPCLKDTGLPEPDVPPTSSPGNLVKPCSVGSQLNDLQMDPRSVDSYCTYLPTPDAPLYSPLTPAFQNASRFSSPQTRNSPEEGLRSVNSHFEDVSPPDTPLCSPMTPLHQSATSINRNILENVTDDNDFSSDDHDGDPNYTPGIGHSKVSSSSDSNNLDTILPSTSNSSLPNASERDITDQGKSKRGRKRKFKEYTLAERKRRRYNNLPYMGKSKEVQPKSYKEFNCSCSKKCFLLVDSETRKTEFLKFYSLTSYEAQLIYITSNVRETPTKRSYKCNNSNTGKNKPRIFSRSYTLCGVSVCKDMFTKNLQISNQKLTISLRKNRSSEGSVKDLRGKRGGWNKTPQEDVDFISNFINKIPKYESHYRRENNGDKQYLQPGMTQRKLYNFYLEEFKESYGESRKSVQFNVFRNIFLTKFNLKCKPLKKDTCNICDRLAVQIKCCTSDETKTCLLQEKDNHLKTAETLRTMMRNDMDNAKNNEIYECLTYDLEKTLPLPRIPTNLAFYKRQLWFYNCGVHAGSTNTGYCFVWVEGEAGRGAQEVGSCLAYYIKNILNKEVKHLVLWSDSCGGQNRNIKITLLLKAVLESHPTLQTITLKYLQPGHTFLPNDTDFSKIETSLKLHSRLYTADDYINVIKNCRIKNPLIVKKMETQHFLGTQKLEKNIVNRKVSVDKNKINWLKIKEILLRKEKLHSLFIKTAEGSEEISIEKKMKGKVLPINESLLCPLYPNGKEIAQVKLDDLRSLYPFIPRDCLHFYKNLKGNVNVLDDVDGLGTTPDFEVENSDEE